MDFEIPQDIQDTLDQLDEFIEREIKPLEQQDDNIRFFDHLREYSRTNFEAGGVPTEDWEALLREMRRRADAAGWLRLALPVEFGGKGANNLTMAIVREHFASKGLGLHNDLQNESSIVGNFPTVLMVHAVGTEAQKQWCEPLITGDMRLAFGLTEPDHGSDPGSMRTRARRDGDDWVVNGSKTWITHGSIADVAVVWANAGEEDGGIRGFVVPTDTPGFAAHTITHKMSLRASVTSELTFENLRLPADAVLPDVTGLKGPLACLSEARYGIVWGSLGAARSSLEAARRYSMERIQFGRPIAGFQLTQAKLANMATELQLGQLLALHLGRRKDTVGLRPEQVSVGKYNNVSKAIEICRTARTILGANGVSGEWPVMRHANNLESVLTYEGTSEVHQLVIGQALTGLAAYR